MLLIEQVGAKGAPTRQMRRKQWPPVPPFEAPPARTLTVDGVGEPDQVTTRLIRAIENRLKRPPNA